MGQRYELQSVLEDVMSDFVDDPENRVHFQPPTGYMLTYPCIIYELNNIDTIYANDKPYHSCKSYTITVIDRNPDSEIPDEIGRLKTSKFNRHYINDNLHHFSYNIYFYY